MHGSALNHSETTPKRSVFSLSMIALIVAGEAIFFLPFVIARVFRPTLLEVFQITNLELGLAFSVYGVVAMIAYFPGGPLADRFAARNLMIVALLTTAIGGIVMAMIPGLDRLKWIYGYWGATTILLFWAALIRATREIGGEHQSGKAFGFVDGGRGLVGAMMGVVAVYVFSTFLPVDVDEATFEQRRFAFTRVIQVFAAMTAAAAVLVFLLIPKTSNTSRDPSASRLAGIKHVIRMPGVWLQAIIIVCAYVGYKTLDDLSLYAKEVLGFDEVSAAYTTTVSMWVRPVAAVLAGIIADKARVSWMAALSFAVMALSCLVIAFGLVQPGAKVVFFSTILVTSSAVFALRGLYFALMQEGDIPFIYTGAAVGVVSLIGYTPDVFIGPLMGKLLDDYPGQLGHQLVFAVAAGFAVLGLIATLIFIWFVGRDKTSVEPVKNTSSNS